MTFKTYFFLFFIALFFTAQVSAECVLNETPSMPIQKWGENIEMLIQEIKNTAGADTGCNKPAEYPNHLDVAIPARSIQNLTGYMQAQSKSIDTLVSEIRYYFDNSGMLLAAEQNHQNSILDLQKKIIDAGVYIWDRCAHDVIIKTNVPLIHSPYTTQGKTLGKILWDMSAQNTEVLKFFRNLIKEVATDQEYSDETLFPIAYKGFAQEMRNFYSPQAIQACHKEDLKNKSVESFIGKSLTAGWKYPQAVQVWKDAFRLLLYRSWSLAGLTDKDASKETEIKNIVQAQKGGMGNSRFMINGQFLKEFGRRGNNQTTFELIKDVGKRIAYEFYGPLFRKQVIGDVARSSENIASINLARYAETNHDANELAAIDRANYNAYAMRQLYVGQNKEQDPKTVTGLIQTIEELEKTRPTIEENVNLACNDVLNKQATNIPHPSCTDFMKG